ncbi:UPF0652 protein [Smittium culicis]|uniref:UPF0652 protein n=1 Tax=Smittium culicis TaxID=133412 RepID=A0A1R1X379_9FUNG|nr:UPF0652 protein [Smittium culicis]OMJ09459.1 UPF0652 protein [Smittium culicis]
MSAKINLKDILDHDEADMNMFDSVFKEDSVSDLEKDAPEGYCVECKDQKMNMYCEDCKEPFCEVCFLIIHRSGKRKLHKYSAKSQPEILISKSVKVPKISQEEIDSDSINAENVDFSKMSNMISESDKSNFAEWITSRAKYIPLRLSVKERKYIRLLEAALNVSEYTDKVDILTYGSRNKRIVAQIQEICAILSGLLDSVSPNVQQMLGFDMVIPIKTVYDVLEYYGAQHVLEDDLVAVATQEIIPEGKSRSQIQQEIKNKERAIEYLSKNYCTSDCTQETIRQCLYSIGDNHAFLRFNRDPCDKMINFLTLDFVPKLAESNELSLAISSGRDGARLSHSHQNQYYYVFQTLTLWREILHELYMLWHHADTDMLNSRNHYRLTDTGQGLNRVQQCQTVSRAVHTILSLTQKKTQRWIGSSVIHLGDHNVPNALMFIDKYNQVAMILNPIAKCVEYINEINTSTKSFLDQQTQEETTLDEQANSSGETTENMSIDDASSGSQQPPSKSKLSSVFSMKIPLNPFEMLMPSYNDSTSDKSRGKGKRSFRFGLRSGSSSSLNSESNGSEVDKSAIRAYIDYTFGGPVNLRKMILADFFRSAFDGSGADNFFDAGSCIDGRLTSAWNWCSQIEKKSYFPVFLLSGFVGFNGETEGL